MNTSTLCSFLFALLLICTPIFGQSAAALRQGEIPSRNGHRFIPSNFVDDPFIKTYWNISIGGGTTLKSDFPILDLENLAAGTFAGELSYYLGGTTFQLALREWVALHIHFDFLGRIGNDVVSLYAQGVSAGTRFDTGWIFRLHNSSHDALSIDFSVSNQNYTSIDIYGYLNAIANGGEPELILRSNPLRAASELRYAYGFNPTLGLTAMLRLSYGETVVFDEKNELLYEIGSKVSIDFLPNYGLPLGLNLGISVNNTHIAFRQNEGAMLRGLVGIAYTGQADFSISLENTFNHSESIVKDETSPLIFYTTTINIRYFF
jgi:hypothetical protein